MIGSIFSNSGSLQVNVGTSSTYINSYNGAQGVGNMRFNTSAQRVEVFDGTNWIILSLSSVNIGLSSEVESLLDWARKKRNEEMMLYSMADQHPAIKDLVNQIEEKQDQIKMIQTLLQSPGDHVKPSMVP